MKYSVYFAVLLTALFHGTIQEISEIQPTNIMEIRDVDGKRVFYNKYDVIDNIFLQPEVADRKLVVLSIIGEYRKGKSFFLDYCLRFLYATYPSISNMENLHVTTDWMGDPNEPLKGFSWKHGRVADTKGIIFWPDVFLYDKPNGEKIAIVVSDTQGLFEVGSTQEENARIFGLSTLISSIQIINIKEVIQENQIEYLEMATSLSQIIMKKQSKSNSKWKPFQKLLFLIRDFHDEDIEGGFGYGGGETYFKEFINDSNIKNSTKAYKVRQNIHNCFDSIQCYLLNHPGEAIHSKKSNGSWGMLKGEFVDNLKKLVESLLAPENLVIKSILGKETTCRQYRNHTYALFDAFSNTELPEITNIFEMTITNEYLALVAEQFKIYHNKLNSDIDFDHENFYEWMNDTHLKLKNDALKNFRQNEINILGDDDIQNRFQIKLTEEIDDYYFAWQERTKKEYERYTAFKNQILSLNKTNEESRAIIKEMEETIKNQTAEYEIKLQETNNKLAESLQQTNKLLVQIQNLTDENKKQNETLQNTVKQLSGNITVLLNAKNTLEAYVNETIEGEKLKWVPWRANKTIPKNAIKGGHNISSKRNLIYYVIQANYGGGLLPGKYSPKDDYGYVATNTKGHEVSDFNVLTGSSSKLIWEPEGSSSGREYFIGGKSAGGDTLYVCRFQIDGHLIVGKLHNRYSKCYVPYALEERSTNSNYEILKYI